MPRTIVTIPTYNEAENIAALIAELRKLDLEVLVADDHSPDGTWRMVQELAAKDDKIHLLDRQSKRGRGYAGAEAFTLALKMGADYIVEMDADFSHQPKYIPEFLKALAAGADLAVGSRLVTGGRDQGRAWYRVWLTRFSAWYARTVLGMSLRDINSGFRAFSRAAMEAINPSTLISAGPSIVHEVYARAKALRLKIVEVPITFIERERGASALTVSRLLDGFRKVWQVRRTTKSVK